MACRDIQKANAAKDEIEREINSSGSLRVEELDLSSFKSVKQFVNRILSVEQFVHILVNNAGVMMCPESKTADGLEMHFGTNHCGHALLTILLLGKLRESAPSRIIFVSSMVHEWHPINIDDVNFENTPYDATRAYCSSKCANILFAKAMATKLKEHNITNVTTYSLHPGVIRTDIGRHFHETLAFGATWFFRHVLCWFMKSPRCGAQTTVYCAVDEECADQSGFYYKDCRIASPSEYCLSPELCIRLWDITLKLLNLSEEQVFSNKTNTVLT